MLAGLHKPTELIVVTLLSYGCPIQAIVRVMGSRRGRLRKVVQVPITS